jgi:PAS domain S-box-containing protein
MTVDWTILIVGLFGGGTIAGIILYFLNKKNTDSLNQATIDQKAAEVRKIEHDLESQYIKQLEQWLVDLQNIKDRHETELSKKDDEIVNLHKQYLNTLKDLAEHKFQLGKLGHAIRKLLIDLDIAYWECDSNGLLTYANGAWLRLHGLTQEQALGEGWQAALLPETRKHMLLQWNATVVDQSEKVIEFVVNNPTTGEKFPAKAIYSIVNDSGGNIVKIIGVTIKV